MNGSSQLVQQGIAWSAFGFLIVERLVELHLSRRNAQRVLSRGGIEYGADHYRWMVVAHSAFLASTVVEWIFVPTRWPLTTTVAALALLLATMALRYWAILTLGDRWNTRVLVEPGVEAVAAGPYRWLLHPNYVAVVLELVALPLLLGGWRTALVFSVVNAWVLSVRIRCENRALHQHCDARNRYA